MNMPRLTLNGHVPVPLALRAVDARRASTGPRSGERGRRELLLLPNLLSVLCFNEAARCSLRAGHLCHSQNVEQEISLTCLAGAAILPLVEITSSIFRSRTGMDRPNGESVREPRVVGAGRGGGDDCSFADETNFPDASTTKQS